MNLLVLKILAIIFLIVGEILTIYAEMMAARNFSINSNFFGMFFQAFLTVTLAGLFVISGYMLGFKAFKNIWLITAFSITSILLVEPILAYIVFRQIPTKGATLGLFLGTLGMLATIFE
ncbi:hypothetical protein [Brasilonema bromeliae]|uniref:EamA domain-containing protein n=1 Tax=Brasilonema bromeliae SPC951 TaxID=385972 RepID=A0ABX1PEW4_9CYAN|nr:hypothetical protein [Brasilonema bromeliae]NMG22488.1 hypothetical protein [Brasilonema bromeliae SPC951]